MWNCSTNTTEVLNLEIGLQSSIFYEKCNNRSPCKCYQEFEIVFLKTNCLFPSSENWLHGIKGKAWGEQTLWTLWGQLFTGYFIFSIPQSTIILRIKMVFPCPNNVQIYKWQWNIVPVQCFKSYRRNVHDTLTDVQTESTKNNMSPPGLAGRGET
jgi:hypothetical protein